MKATVNVFLKEGILDTQGKATLHALKTLGFDSLSDVRIGKQIVLTVRDDAKADVQKMVDELLVNGVIEEYGISFQ